MRKIIQLILFARWVAEEVLKDDFADGTFAELACRKLAKLGIVGYDDDVWYLK